MTACTCSTWGPGNAIRCSKSTTVGCCCQCHVINEPFHDVPTMLASELVLMAERDTLRAERDAARARVMELERALRYALHFVHIPHRGGVSSGACGEKTCEEIRAAMASTKETP